MRAARGAKRRHLGAHFDSDAIACRNHCEALCRQLQLPGSGLRGLHKGAAAEPNHGVCDVLLVRVGEELDRLHN